MGSEVKTLTELKKEVRIKCLHMRSIDRTVNTIEFQEAVKLAGIEPALEKINNLDSAGLLEWISEVLNKELGDKSIRQLRDIARDMNIPYYTSKTKDQLLVLIVQAREHDRRTKEASGGLPHQTEGQVSPGVEGHRRELLDTAGEGRTIIT